MIWHSPSLGQLMQHFPHAGELCWIGIRPARGEDMQVLTSVEADASSGLVGDRYQAKSAKRQVTLIQWEHLAVISAFTQQNIDPNQLRRNLVIKGINLLALKQQCFQIGAVTFEYTGLCQPCSKMEARLGPGAYNALRGHGGITAQIISGGRLNLGDAVQVSTLIDSSEGRLSSGK